MGVSWPSKSFYIRCGARSGPTGGTNPARSSTEDSNPGIWDGPAGGLSSLVSQDYLLSDIRRTAGPCLCSVRSFGRPWRASARPSNHSTAIARGLREGSLVPGVEGHSDVRSSSCLIALP